MFQFQYGDTPLHTAARYGHAGVIRILVSAKCNTSEQNKVCQYSRPKRALGLFFSSFVLTKVALQFSRAQGLKYPHVRSSLFCFQNGDTALHISAAMGRRKLTRLLLESGCDKRVRNKQHETAADIAQRKQLAEIYAILRNFEQQPSPVKLGKRRLNS